MRRTSPFEEKNSPLKPILRAALHTSQNTRKPTPTVQTFLKPETSKNADVHRKPLANLLTTFGNTENSLSPKRNGENSARSATSTFSKRSNYKMLEEALASRKQDLKARAAAYKAKFAK